MFHSCLLSIWVLLLAVYWGNWVRAPEWACATMKQNGIALGLRPRSERASPFNSGWWRMIEEKICGKCKKLQKLKRIYYGKKEHEYSYYCSNCQDRINNGVCI